MSKQNHLATSSNSLNKLRAAVLGANDGIVSTAGLVLGVTGAAAQKETIVLAGAAGLIAGAISMAAGEFVSVSSQRDSERSFIYRKQQHIAKDHNSSTDELIELYVDKGMSKQTATLVAKELEAKQLVDTEIEKELGVDPNDLSSPWSAALSSAAAFTAGALVPLAAIFFSPAQLLLPITIGAVVAGLVLTGALSAHAGQANQLRAALRIVIWGVGAMAVTYAIGSLVGTAL